MWLSHDVLKYKLVCGETLSYSVQRKGLPWLRFPGARCRSDPSCFFCEKNLVSNLVNLLSRFRLCQLQIQVTDLLFDSQLLRGFGGGSAHQEFCSHATTRSEERRVGKECRVLSWRQF